jgi:hypothetical protein
MSYLPIAALIARDAMKEAARREAAPRRPRRSAPAAASRITLAAWRAATAGPRRGS